MAPGNTPAHITSRGTGPSPSTAGAIPLNAPAHRPAVGNGQTGLITTSNGSTSASAMTFGQDEDLTTAQVTEKLALLKDELKAAEQRRETRRQKLDQLRMSIATISLPPVSNLDIQRAITSVDEMVAEPPPSSETLTEPQKADFLRVHNDLKKLTEEVYEKIRQTLLEFEPLDTEPFSYGDDIDSGFDRIRSCLGGLRTSTDANSNALYDLRQQLDKSEADRLQQAIRIRELEAELANETPAKMHVTAEKPCLEDQPAEGEERREE